MGTFLVDIALSGLILNGLVVDSNCPLQFGGEVLRRDSWNGAELKEG